MALDLESLSITSAFNSIINFFKSQENNSKWRELDSSSEGSFLIRLLANVMSTLSYRIVAQSRENYLSSAALPSSNIGISVNLGYSVFRGSNLKRKIKITPTGNYTLSKFSVIGTYSNDYNILTLGDVELVEGEPIEVETVVGNLREESFIAGTSDTKIFSLFTTEISEDFILLKDNEEVPTTSIIKDMINDKYLVRTNPYSSVDIAYLNSFEGFKYKYGTGTEFTIRYVELADVPVVPYSSGMFTYGVLNDYSTTSLYKPFDSVDSIKINAPLQHETQNLIRSKADYANRLQDPNMIPTISEVNFKAVTPTYTQVTYVKEHFNLLTGTKLIEGSSYENEEILEGTEVAKVNSVLKDENYFGTPLPDITVPRREVADLKIQLALTNKYKSISDINLDINNILSNYYNKFLAVTFNTYDLERILEELSYVKYARVSYTINERNANTNYQLGYIIKNGDNYYKVSKILGYAAETEPEDGWPVPVSPGGAIDTLTVVKDGSIYWKCYKRLPNMKNISKRQPSGQYGIGDFMYVDILPDYMFKCIDIVKTSGGISPDTTGLKLGEFLVDGGVVWVVTDRISDAPNWVSFSQYRIGDTVNAIGDSFSLQCISYTGYTGTSDSITFESYEYPVVSIGYSSNSFRLQGNQTFYFKSGDIIKAEYSGGYTYFVVASSSYNIGENLTLVKVQRYQDGTGEVIDSSKDYRTLLAVERGTRDGGVLWTLVDNIEKIEYDWNSYVTFSHTLEILEQ